jgi:UDP-N-acetylglucosamine 2-epimerase (non-hydrolysing)
MKRILLILGTRPEAIKLSPLYFALKEHASFDVRVCVTGQHRQMLDQVLEVFGIAPDYDLNLMHPGQTLSQLAARTISALETTFADAKPDLAIVQGDTTTTFAGALSAFYHHVPVGHVEAGLRTWDLLQPFPEEMNRVLTTRIAALHFAPTAGAARNLKDEGVPESAIHVTGNTGLDAALYVTRELEAGRLPAADVSFLDAAKRLVLVTAHRRENFGDGVRSICAAVRRIASRGDTQVVYPVHSNPNISGPVWELLADDPNIVLLDPLDYVPFLDLMRRSYLILTDSGGVQEEAPSLGKPVLVLREKTERPEAVEAGTVRLVGTDCERIAGEASRLLDDPEAYRAMAWAHNPYGDGHASARIAGHIQDFFDAGRSLRIGCESTRKY